MENNGYLPNSDYSERVVLGAALLNNSLMNGSIAQLSTDNFALATHRELYDLMRAKTNAGTPFDIHTLIAESQHNSNLSAAYICDLTTGVVPDEALMPDHVSKIRESAIRRETLKILAETETAIHDGQSKPGDVIQFHQRRIQELSRNFDDSGILSSGKDDVAGLELMCASNIECVEREWIVPDFLPTATLTLVVGAPGVGKTTAVLAMLAEITRGQVPIVGGDRAPASVFMLSNEDSPSDTHRNFRRVSGDPSRLFVENYDDLDWNLAGTKALEARIRQLRPAAVVIDSLFTHSPGKVDVYKHTETAGMLKPLRQIAERNSCALVLIHHTNKSASSDPLLRTSGSQGIIATCRHSLLIGSDPGDENARVCVVQKTNLGRLKLAYRFQLDPFRWLGACDLTANDISRQPSWEEPPNSMGEAVEFLSGALSSGPRPSKEIEAQAKERGISGSTFRRAKTRLGVISRKEGFSGGWLLCIEGAHEDAQGAHGFSGSSFSTFDQANA